MTFSASEQAEMRRLSTEGHGAAAISRMIKREHDAVNYWLSSNGLLRRQPTRTPAPVTLPKVGGVS